MLNSSAENTVAVCNKFKSPKTGDCIVFGNSQKVSSIEFFEGDPRENIVGEYIGISKWSNSFINNFETFLFNYFKEFGKNDNYEIPLNFFIKKTKNTLFYNTFNLPWKNINYESDYISAKNELYNKIYGV